MQQLAFSAGKCCNIAFKIPLALLLCCTIHCLQELERSDEDIVEVDMHSACVLVNETKLKVDLTKYAERHQFNFDEALDEYVTNDQVYRVTVEPLVHTLFQNGKATCFAYGQTGSGKTFTMSPLPIRAAADILQYLARPELRDVSLFVSCFEIYGNKVFDLLNMRKKLNILEDGKKKVCVVGLKVSCFNRCRAHAAAAGSCMVVWQSKAHRYM